MVIKIFILLFSICLNSCLVAFLPAEDDHEKIFELLYEDMKRFYAYDDEIKLFDGTKTLDGVYQKFQKRLSKKKLTQMEFAFFLKDFQNRIADPHFYFNFGQSIEDELIKSYKNPYTALQEKKPKTIVWGNLYSAKYIDYLKKDNNSAYFYGMIKNKYSAGKKIGHIIVNHVVQQLAGSSRLGGNRKWLLEIETILKELKKNSVESIIIDIRTYAGGSQDNGRFIASRFVNNGEKVYLLADERINDRAFTRSKIFVRPEGEGFRENKVILLANQITCSGGEMFTLAMRQRTNMIQVGNRTRGCTGGIIAKDLINGWKVTMTSSKTYYPDPKDENKGISYFRGGIPTDDEVSYTEQDYQQAKDKELLRAIDLLKDEILFQTIYQKIERYQ